MIEAISGKGVGRARVTCDICARSDTVACGYERINSREGGWVPNEGQVIRKLEGQKWAFVKGKLHCPACEAKRKAHDPKPKQEAKVIEMKTRQEAAADIREPTARMTAQIVGLLEDAYDDKAKRYRSPTDSDKTIAEVIGGGCMWGWVAAIREKEFGPDTRNAEVDAIRADFRKLDGRISAAIGEIRQVETEANALRTRLDKLA